MPQNIFYATVLLRHHYKNTMSKKFNIFLKIRFVVNVSFVQLLLYFEFRATPNPGVQKHAIMRCDPSASRRTTEPPALPQRTAVRHFCFRVMCCAVFRGILYGILFIAVCDVYMYLRLCSYSLFGVLLLHLKVSSALFSLFVCNRYHVVGT